MQKLLLFLVVLSVCSAFKKYAEPLKMSNPNKDGVYEFDLVVEKKLTMSFQGEYSHRYPVDYDVKTKSWTYRDPDQLKDCHLSHSMTSVGNRTFTEEFEDILILDGKHYRVITINGETPGPVLTVPYGAEVLLRVTNKLMLDGFTIHVHGLDKQGLWFEDGVAFVQQCPIATGSLYEYRFLADRSGTHWYHGHLQSDRGDGLLGGFVVYHEDGTVPKIDDERVIPDREYFVMIQDWNHEETEHSWMSLQEKTMKWMYGMDGNEKCWQPTRMHDGGNVGGATPFSAVLINSKGWHNLHDIKQRPHSLPLETFRIKKGEHVLFRMVNGGLAQEMMVHIEGHQMYIVAGDGNEIKPIKVDKLIIFPGERYDVLIEGLENPHKKVFHMVVETIQYYYFDWTRVETQYGIANIEYEDVPERVIKRPHHPPDLTHSECTLEDKCTVLNCPFEEYPPDFPFHCLHYADLESPYDILDKGITQDTPFEDGFEEHFINMHFDSHVNGFKFIYPTGMPFYYHDRMDEIAPDCEKVNCPREHEKYDDRCRCFYHLKHKLNNIVQITLYNMGVGGGLASGYAHPFHIHGTHVYVMKMGWPSYNSSGMIDKMNPDIPCLDDKTVCDNLKWSNSSWFNGAVPGMNTKNPSLRDAILLPVGGYVTVRFRAVNPGWYFAHCHLALHNMGGAAYAYRVGEHHEIPPPPANFKKDCGVYRREPLPPSAHDYLKKVMEEDRLQFRRQKRNTREVNVNPKENNESNSVQNHRSQRGL